MLNNSRKLQIIKETQSIVQEFGFKDFSLSCVSKKLNLHKSSILYYFDNVNDLIIQALIDYRTNFLRCLQDIINKSITLLEKFDQYICIHKQTLVNERKVCLCAALGSDFLSLPIGIQNQLRLHVMENQIFIFTIVSQALNIDNLGQKSRLFIDSLQGLMMNFRIRNDIDNFDNDVKLLINQLFF